MSYLGLHMIQIETIAFKKHNYTQQVYIQAVVNKICIIPKTKINIYISLNLTIKTCIIWTNQNKKNEKIKE